MASALHFKKLPEIQKKESGTINERTTVTSTAVYRREEEEESEEEAINNSAVRTATATVTPTLMTAIRSQR
jgi:hypothetical protein